MAVSVFDLFKVGIGPSSSHTVGPMRAARLFAQHLQHSGLLPDVTRIDIDLLGSLGATGRGHATDRAVMLGLMGHEPATVPIESIPGWIDAVKQHKRLRVLDQHDIDFDPALHLHWRGLRSLPFHPNAMTLRAGTASDWLHEATYYSVGGGFIVHQDLVNHPDRQAEVAPHVEVLPRPFHSAIDLLGQAHHHQCSIAEVMRHNETHWRSPEETDAGLMHIWSVMQACVQRGCSESGELPGGFKVQRRAALLARRLAEAPGDDPLLQMDRVTLYALAVNEENAAGGRVVTAPTNGAAGIIPAVLHHYRLHVPHASDEGVRTFLLTAGAIGLLYKENASISGAEVGCQGEVGVACSMAAAGLCAAMGGTPQQVENAAEIGMEHHLGLTCDPVGGLVQIPCIERNAVGAVQAIQAARLALLGDGQHRVSLDQVIATMKQTGQDMQSRYKETALGGLAVNIVAC